jgi:hypothetical protein
MSVCVCACVRGRGGGGGIGVAPQADQVDGRAQVAIEKSSILGDLLIREFSVTLPKSLKRVR